MRSVQLHKVGFICLNWQFKSFGWCACCECKQHMPAHEKVANNMKGIRLLNQSLEALCPSSSQVFNTALRSIRGQCAPRYATIRMRAAPHRF